MARYALVIGIAEYKNPLQRLPKTTTDAEAVVQVLKKYGDFQQIIRLPQRWNQERQGYEIAAKAVTGKELGEALRNFLLEQAVGDDALIYFTGHGFKISDNLGQEKGYLATSDCIIQTDGNRIVEIQNGIALDSFNELIRASNLKSLVLLLDCCHSGYFLERQLVEHSLTAISSRRDYYLITACRDFEEAIAFDFEQHDVFTGALIEGLSVENAGKDGQISGDRVFAYISSALKGSKQEPIRMGWGRSITLVTYPKEDIIKEEIVFNTENPYRGLYSFESKQEKYFCGRKEAIYALLDRLSSNRFIAVIGPSGCGKSSLVKAGLLPHLERDQLPGSSQWGIETFIPEKHPFTKLIEILDLQHKQNQPFVLFIDQMEEIFTLCEDDAERQSFIRLMANEATNSERLTRIIVAIRTDFLDRCAAYPEVANLINRTQPTTYIVTPLSRQELEEAIEGPASLHGVKFERGLISQIAHDVDDQPGALPLLQYALKELWRVCIEKPDSPEPRLTLKGYKEIGGVKGALENRANLLYQSFSLPDQLFVRQMFMELVQLGEENTVTRRRASWERLEADTDSIDQRRRVVRLLAKHRLIVTDEDTVEVAHEALLTEWTLLRGWIEENRENIRLGRLLEAECREWRARFKKSDEALLTGAKLAVIAEWKDKNQPIIPVEEAEFLQNSLARRDKEIQEELEQERKLREAAEARAKAEAEKAEQERVAALAKIETALEAEARAKAEANEQAARAKAAEANIRMQKQRTRFAIGVGVLAVFTLGLGSLATVIEGKKRESDAFAAGALITKSEQLWQTNNQLEALMASVEALQKLKEIDRKEQSDLKRIYSVIYNVQERNRLEGHQGGVYSVSFSPDGERIASIGVDKKIIIWGLEGKILVPPIEGHQDQGRSVKFSHDSKLFASSSIDDTVKVWSKQGKLLYTLRGHQDNVYDVSFSKDNKQIASSSKDGSIKIWDVEKGRLIRTLRDKQSLKKKEAPIYEINFSPVNKSIVVSTGFKDYDISIWDLSQTTNDTSKHIGKTEFIVKSVRFNQTGNMIASGDSQGMIKIWNAQGILIGQIKASEDIIFHLEFSKDSKFIAYAGLDGLVKIYNVDEVLKLWSKNKYLVDKPLAILKGNTGAVNSISFNPKNSKVIASANDDGSIRIWNFLEKSDRIDTNYTIHKLLMASCNFLNEYHNNIIMNKKAPPKSHVICNNNK